MKRMIKAMVATAAAFVCMGVHAAVGSGGFVVKPGSQHGKILFVNMQKTIPASELREVTDVLGKDIRYNFVLAEGGEGDVTVRVVDDPAKPALLVAPEDGWAEVNVAKLGVGLKSEEARKKFLAARVRKEMIKAFAYACGAGGSQFQGNVLTAATVADLDFCKEFLPMDSYSAAMKKLAARGITPERRVPYRRACHEGWAPAPTNEIQKAIWDKVHAQPKNPMKIEFDPKKGK